MKEISLEDWETRFITTTLLYDTLVNMKDEYKRKIGLTNSKIGVWIPDSRGYNLVLKHLAYDEHWNRFYWVK